LSDGDDEDNLFCSELPVTLTESAAVEVVVLLAVFDPAALTPLAFVVALAPAPEPEPAPEAVGASKVKKPLSPRNKVDSVEAIVVRGTLGGLMVLRR
jgi:hypothetical protein